MFKYLKTIKNGSTWESEPVLLPVGKMTAMVVLKSSGSITMDRSIDGMTFSKVDDFEKTGVVSEFGVTGGANGQYIKIKTTTEPKTIIVSINEQ